VCGELILCSVLPMTRVHVGSKGPCNHQARGWGGWENTPN